MCVCVCVGGAPIVRIISTLFRTLPGLSCVGASRASQNLRNNNKQAWCLKLMLHNHASLRALISRLSLAFSAKTCAHHSHEPR